jgi:uncharacterized membrane protein YcgQ (UPF0703/DUF1980 family)
MRENKSVRNTLTIAAAVMAIAVTFIIIYNNKSGNGSFAATGDVIETKRSPVSKGDVIEIKEKMFISQVNDVYLNKDDYLGKKIKLEGLFKIAQGNERAYCFVLRYGPGCCGYDGNVGFEVAWDKDKEKPYPGEDSWVEATGELKTYEEDGYNEFLYLDLVSLNVLDKRGQETVMQ